MPYHHNLPMTTIPATGPVNYSDFNLAKSVASNTLRNLSDMYGFAAGVPASGTISMSQLRGKSSVLLAAGARMLDGSVHSSEIRDVAFDSSGNMYVAGYFMGYNLPANTQIPVANQDGTASSQTLEVLIADHNAFIVRYTPSGVCDRALTVLIGGPTQCRPTGIAVDTAGTVYMTGVYTNVGTTLRNFNKTNSAFSLPGIPSTQSYIVKYDASGTCTGGCSFIGRAFGMSVVTDSANNVYVGGYIGWVNSAGQSGGGAQIIQNLNGTNSSFSFSRTQNTGIVVKYNSSGMAQWATEFTGAPVQISLDADGNLFVFRITAGQNSVASPRVCRVNTSNGSMDRDFPFANSTTILGWNDTNWSPESYTDIVHDSNGNLYMTGVYWIDIGFTAPDLQTGAGSRGVPVTRNWSGSPGSRDFTTHFLIKYNSSGVCTNAIQPYGLGSSLLQYSNSFLTGASFFVGNSVAVDSNGNVYIAGRYHNTTATLVRNMDGSDSTVTLPASTGNTSVFVIKYDSSGICQAAVDVLIPGSYSTAFKIICNGNNVYLAGSYNSGYSFAVKDLTGSNTSSTLPNTSQTTAYLVRL
jgi:hypothetical protein